MLCSRVSSAVFITFFRGAGKGASKRAGVDAVGNSFTGFRQFSPRETYHVNTHLH